MSSRGYVPEVLMNLNEFSRIERESGRHAAMLAARRFILADFGLYKREFPPLVTEMVNLALRLQVESVDRAETDNMVSRAWADQDERGITYNWSTETLALRVALCLICREEDGHDISEIVEWFLGFMDRIEDHSSQAPDIFRAALTNHGLKTSRT